MRRVSKMGKKESEEKEDSTEKKPDEKKDRKPSEKKSSDRWQKFAGSTIVFLLVIGLILMVAVPVYKELGKTAVDAVRSSNEPQRITPTAAEEARRMREATPLTKDTTFVVTAKEKVPTHFVLEHGCQVKTGEVNPAHSYIFENQRDRFAVLPGEDVPVGVSTRFTLYALGAAETEVRVSVYDCPSEKAKPPTSSRS